METLVINGIGREKRYALIKEGTVEKLVIEQPKQQSLVGNIFLGIVQKVLPGMNAAFIDIGLEKNGYIHRDKLSAYQLDKTDRGISSFLQERKRIVVQIEKDATGGKGPRLTEVVEFSGDYLVYMPTGNYVAVSKKMTDETAREKWRRFGYQIRENGEGLLFRTACEEANEDAVMQELQQLRMHYQNVLSLAKQQKKPSVIFEEHSFLQKVKKEMEKMTNGKVVVDTREMKVELEKANDNKHLEVIHVLDRQGIFSIYRVEQEIEKALRRVIWLDNGAYLIFDDAEALTVIDVNTGKFSGKYNYEDTILKTNELAAWEIARQIRLRNLAGMILVDFIDMKSDKERDYIKRIVETALQADEQRTRVIGFTALGVLQLTRKKTSVAIAEALTQPCSACQGKGKVLSSETIAYQLERELLELGSCDDEALLIETTQEVKEIFVGNNKSEQSRLEHMMGSKIFFTLKEKENPFYHIKQFGPIKEIEKKVSQAKGSVD